MWTLWTRPHPVVDVPTSGVERPGYLWLLLQHFMRQEVGGTTPNASSEGRSSLRNQDLYHGLRQGRP